MKRKITYTILRVPSNETIGTSFGKSLLGDLASWVRRFFPDPPEMSVVVQNWPSIRAELADIDLDTYRGYDKVAAFAPKSRLNVRRVSLLHPYDLIFFTALVLELRDGVSASRLPAHEDRVFSYRSEEAGENELYSKAPGYRDFRDAVEGRVQKGDSNFVGITDIGDFYPS